MFDRVTADRQTCIATTGLNAYRHERSCHYLIILSLPERFHAFHLGDSCCVKPIAILHLTVDACTSHVYCTYSYMMIGSGCPEVT